MRGRDEGEMPDREMESKETPPKPEHSTGQHSMPTNENQGRPSSIAAWRTSRGVRGENVVDADGSAAFLEGLEERARKRIAFQNIAQASLKPTAAPGPGQW